MSDTEKALVWQEAFLKGTRNGLLTAIAIMQNHDKYPDHYLSGIAALKREAEFLSKSIAAMEKL